MDYGQMKLHIRDVLFKGDKSYLVKPVLVVRDGLFQVISDHEQKQSDIEVIYVTRFELGNGFVGNRWDEITQAAMGAWRTYTNVKKSKNT